IYMMVTPHFMVRPDEEQKRAASASNTPDINKALVAELMKRVGTAYKEGRYSDAEVLAKVACDMDPTNAVCQATVKLARRKQQIHAPPKVAPGAAAESEAAACLHSPGDGLVEILAGYRQACAAGRRDEAWKLACCALAIDPTCFSKSHARVIPPPS